MRKLSILVLAIAISVMCVLPAFSLAEGRKTFSITINCASENDALKYVRTYLKCQTNNHRVSVSHSSTETSNSYTNLFHAVKSNTEAAATGILCGQKWCTPNMTVNIASNAIVADYYYGLAVRGNTKYNEYEDLTSFTISGSYKPF